MSEYSVFDVVGPIMVGPSSSHTAGAVRLGYISRKIFGREFFRVEFYLHGSFAKTRSGHGTDKALLAGVLGFLPDNEKIRDVFECDESRQIEYAFHEVDLGDVHPNSVRIRFWPLQGDYFDVVGSSVGGGKIKIIKINDTPVEFEGNYSTLIVNHRDYPGVISAITSILAEKAINVAFMKVYREAKGESAILIAETDEQIPETVIERIKVLEKVFEVQVVYPI